MCFTGVAIFNVWQLTVQHNCSVAQGRPLLHLHYCYVVAHAASLPKLLTRICCFSTECDRQVCTLANIVLWWCSNTRDHDTHKKHSLSDWISYVCVESMHAWIWLRLIGFHNYAEKNLEYQVHLHRNLDWVLCNHVGMNEYLDVVAFIPTCGWYSWVWASIILPTVLPKM